MIETAFIGHKSVNFLLLPLAMSLEMDLNYKHLSKAHVLRKYQQNLDVLRRYALQLNLKEEQFDKLVSDDINRMVMPKRSVSWRLRHIANILQSHRKIVITVLLLLSLFALLFFKRPVSTILLRNIQVYIYPVMKLWRKITAPVLLFFPSLTGE